MDKFDLFVLCGMVLVLFIIGEWHGRRARGRNE